MLLGSRLVIVVTDFLSNFIFCYYLVHCPLTWMLCYNIVILYYHCYLLLLHSYPSDHYLFKFNVETPSQISDNLVLVVFFYVNAQRQIWWNSFDILKRNCPNQSSKFCVPPPGIKPLTLCLWGRLLHVCFHFSYSSLFPSSRVITADDFSLKTYDVLLKHALLNFLAYLILLLIAYYF